MKDKKKTIKPMSLEEQIEHIEKALRDNTINDGKTSLKVIEKKVLEAALVTLKRLPKGVS